MRKNKCVNGRLLFIKNKIARTLEARHIIFAFSSFCFPRLHHFYFMHLFFCAAFTAGKYVCICMAQCRSPVVAVECPTYGLVTCAIHFHFIFLLSHFHFRYLHSLEKNK